MHKMRKIYSAQYTSDNAMLPRVPCFRHLSYSGFALTKIISVFLESTNIRRVKLLMTVNLRCMHVCFMFENSKTNHPLLINK